MAVKDKDLSLILLFLTILLVIKSIIIRRSVGNRKTKRFVKQGASKQFLSPGDSAIPKHALNII